MIYVFGYALAFIINQRCHNYDQFCQILCGFVLPCWRVHREIGNGQKKKQSRKLPEMWRKTCSWWFYEIREKIRFVINGSFSLIPLEVLSVPTISPFVVCVCFFVCLFACDLITCIKKSQKKQQAFLIDVRF